MTANYQAHSVEQLFDRLWQHYIKVTPSAEPIQQLLKSQNQQATLVNDHIALRTVNHPTIDRTKLAQHFLNLGYQQKGEYRFETKHLIANHYEPPEEGLPKVFISDLQLEYLSEAAQSILNRIAQTLSPETLASPDILYHGRSWPLNSQAYLLLAEESEYAAWFAAWGFIPNHFTVSVTHLQRTNELDVVNGLLQEHGYALNESGGIIKGGPTVCLAQSATIADRINHNFDDMTMAIPSCFYEFAQRYPLPDGSLYQGFVSSSADKIFESTNQ